MHNFRLCHTNYCLAHYRQFNSFFEILYASAFYNVVQQYNLDYVANSIPHLYAIIVSDNCERIIEIEPSLAKI